MASDWSIIFDAFGSKRVSRTDKNKCAYVLNEAQKSALTAAGLTPSGVGPKRIIDVEILFDPSVSSIRASYYNSLRKGSGRTPETRMGQGLIQWAEVGDEIIIGRNGNRILALKANALPAGVFDRGRGFAKAGDRKRVFQKAKLASGKPAKKLRQVQDFVRDPWVVAAALLRANGMCEMPNCKHMLFRRDDGSPFLEVHHIQPLAENGDDSIDNAAALCPSCHRELHFGKKRSHMRAALRSHISVKPLA